MLVCLSVVHLLIVSERDDKCSFAYDVVENNDKFSCEEMGVIA